jgi:hypothetical protein
VDYDDEENEDEGYVWPHNREERLYRKQVLAALNFEVAEEDIFRTELRRVPKHKPNENELDRAFLTSKFFFRHSLHLNNEGSLMPEGAAKEAMRIAREMGVMGSGLSGEDRWHHHHEESFLAEFLELKWPPEGRLIERDCTCDLWDKIRCKFD